MSTKGFDFTPLKDLTGQKFGRLTVIERAENKSRYTCWKCRCTCGNVIVVMGRSLSIGNTKSCGCLQKEKTSEMLIKRNTKHGMTHTSIYNVWRGIKDRCFNPNHHYYQYYGGRDITLCDEWLDFQNFYDYVSQLPHFGKEGYSLDRIDNNGNYEPDNLRWADRNTQSRNRRNNIIVEYEGEKITLKESAKKSGIRYSTLQSRYRNGDRGEKLFRPVRHKAKSSNS